MAWIEANYGAEAARARAERAVQAQMGMLSPLWVAFGAAAGVGVTWWWMTRWTTPSSVESIPADNDSDLEFEADVSEPEDQMLQNRSDDLTRLNGVGPKIAAALEARGVTTFAQLAAWRPEDLATFAAELNLKGRALRSDLIEQARIIAAAEI